MEILSQSKGYVYILINPSMPGLLKIGKSTRSPEARAMELSQATGVPYSFQVAYQTLVDDCDVAEKEIHESLNVYRTKKNREFFRIPLNQAIDLIRKVIADKGLKSNNLDIEPYKFAFEEFYSPESLISFILSDEDKWEQAKLHLESGYLEDWLKKKGEFDALINIEKYSDRRKQQDFFLSLISFSVVSSKFKWFGYEFESLSSLYYECHNLPTNVRLIQLMLSGKLLEVYEGYLKGKNLDDDPMMDWFKFSDESRKSKTYNYENRKDRILKILEWKLYPSSFLHFDNVNFQQANNLVSKIQWLADTSQFYVPKQVLDDALSRDEEKVKRAISYVSALKEKFIEEDEFGDDWYSNGLNEYLPCLNYIQEAQELTPEEYLNFLEGLLPQRELKELSLLYILPLKLSEHLTKDGKFLDFIYAKELIRFLLGEDWRVYSILENNPEFNYRLFLNEIKNRYRNLVTISDFDIEQKKVKELPHSIQLYLREKYPKKSFKEEVKISQYYFNPMEIDDLWIQYLAADKVAINVSFWEYPSTVRTMNSFLKEVRSYCPNNESHVRGQLIEKKGLKQEIEKCIQDYVIPKQVTDLFDKNNFLFISYFGVSIPPKILKQDLEERLIPNSLMEGIKSDTIKENYAAINRISSILNPQETKYSYSLPDKKKALDFNIKLFPTQEYLTNFIIPEQLREKLISHDLEIFSKGISEFMEYRIYFIPKKTYYALDHEFLLPTDLKIKILGDDTENYVEAVKILCDWGLILVNGSEEWEELYGVKGFAKWEELYISKYNTFSTGEYEVFENDEEKQGLSYKESIRKVLCNLRSPEVKRTLAIEKNSILVKMSSLQSYVESIGDKGMQYFSKAFSKTASNHTLFTSIDDDGKVSSCNSFHIDTINYREASNIIQKKYDKGLDKVIQALLQNLSLKLFFLPKGLRVIVVKYLEFVLGVNKVMSKEDGVFILELAKYVQMPLLVLLFKKRNIFNLLKENYFLYRHFDFGSSQVIYLFNQPAWKKGIRQ